MFATETGTQMFHICVAWSLGEFFFGFRVMALWGMMNILLVYALLSPETSLISDVVPPYADI